MPPTTDIEAYFARVGHAGPRAATLETARELRLRHVQAIPFENLDPVLARPVRLDLPALEQNLIRDGRAANYEADARERCASTHRTGNRLSSAVPDASGLEAAITRFLHAD